MVAALQRLHGSGQLLASAIFDFVDIQNHGLEFMPLWIILLVVAYVESTVFIRHISRCRGDDAMLANIVALDIRGRLQPTSTSRNKKETAEA